MFVGLRVLFHLRRQRKGQFHEENAAFANRREAFFRLLRSRHVGPHNDLLVGLATFVANVGNVARMWKGQYRSQPQRLRVWTLT